MDTVHAVGKFGPEPFLVKDDRVYGPGVYDMKGGDVIALFVLRALNAVAYVDRQIKLVLTGDEEVANAFSHGEAGKLVEQYASGCEAAFDLGIGLHQRRSDYEKKRRRDHSRESKGQHG